MYEIDDICFRSNLGRYALSHIYTSTQDKSLLELSEFETERCQVELVEGLWIVHCVALNQNSYCNLSVLGLKV